MKREWGWNYPRTNKAYKKDRNNKQNTPFYFKFYKVNVIKKNRNKKFFSMHKIIVNLNVYAELKNIIILIFLLFYCVKLS